MSRLDSHIQQKIAQRDTIDLAARWLGDRQEWIVEFGLGNGRSYSHLRERFPGREIFCFDRVEHAHPKSRPPADHLILGEFPDVLADPALHRRFEGRVMLLHVDVGSGGPEDEVIPEQVVERTYRWLVPGAIVLSDQDLTLSAAWHLAPTDTGASVQHGERYRVYRRSDDHRGRPG
jgi:hypothetical protein